VCSFDKKREFRKPRDTVPLIVSLSDDDNTRTEKGPEVPPALEEMALNL
jgi:hypothetical protein